LLRRPNEKFYRPIALFGLSYRKQAAWVIDTVFYVQDFSLAASFTPLG
jgi:hypothetical protein